MQYFVYILSNATHTILYTGVTRNLLRRVQEHRDNVYPHSFTAKYTVHCLVYYESTDDVRAAIDREKQIKSWSRKRKNQLIETLNPTWKDLYSKLLEW